ncbi:MAG: LPS export ABC transporter periplasmic protein LptC [Armatimonadetes bacterium RBG_16_58_9]|nr:MAG: LPS export ABC transporter periplasmic protein LptC [Armatimonadetes bacterium RBG_16_58_9]
MRGPPYISLAIAAGIILLVSVVAFKRYLPYVGNRIGPIEPAAIVQAMEDVRLVGLGETGKRWSLRAGKVEIARNRSVTTLTGISEGSIFDQGKVALTVDAGKAVYDQRSDELALSGGITVEGRKGERVSAEGAKWDGRTSKLVGQGRVEVSGKWGSAQGSDLVVDARQKEITMTNVSGSLRLNDRAL